MIKLLHKSQLLLGMLFITLGGVVGAEQPATCKDPPFAALQSAVVSLEFRYLKKAADGSLGHRANGVFISATEIATVGHVTAGMLEAAGGAVGVGWSHGNGSVVDEVDTLSLPIVSLTTIDTGLSESLSVIELPAGVLGRDIATVHAAPLIDGAPVFSIFYSQKQRAHYATGWYRAPQYQQNEKSGLKADEPFMQFQLVAADTQHEIVVDKGVSGSPIFDCTGNLVSLVSDTLVYPGQNVADSVLPKSMRKANLLSPSIAQAVRWWQEKPNVAAIPASVYVPK